MSKLIAFASSLLLGSTVAVAADEVEIRNALNTAVIGGVDLVPKGSGKLTIDTANGTIVSKGISAGRASRGHRFLSSGDVVLPDGTARDHIKSAMLVAKVEGVDHRNGAEALTGVELYLPREKLPAPEEEEFYIADLVGLRAGAGFRADHGGHVRAAESDHRHSLWRHRSQGSSRRIRGKHEYRCACR